MKKLSKINSCIGFTKEDYRLGDFSSVLARLCEDKMVGIVSKADFVTLAVGIAFDKITVKEIMTKDVVGVSPNDRLIHSRIKML